MRKRRSNRSAKPCSLDQAVVMYAPAEAQSSTDHRDWLYRSVTRRMAERMVTDGEAQQIELDTPNGRIICFRELKTMRGAAYRSPATLTFATMTAVGKHALGYKLTPGELKHVEKFIVWPLIGDTKAPAVRPRMSAGDKNAAEKLFCRPRCNGRRTAPANNVRTMHFSAPLGVAA